MVTREQVEASLGKVVVPVVLRSVMDMNLLRSVDIRDSRMKVALANAALAEDIREQLTHDIQEHLVKLDGIEAVGVDFEEARPVEVNQVRHPIAIMSGKGGVGKSLVAALMGVAMAREGKAVGILDADVTGPSVPRMFGLKQRPAGSESGLMPVVSQSGVEIMSINLLLPNEDDAVIWRGPIISRSIQQFWEDVLWGKLDYLIVDMPPGTSDIPLTVMQSIPLTGVIIAFTPQELTAMVVRKAVKMAGQMNVPVLGVVENMSYFLVPETGTRIEIFGPSKAGEMAKSIGAPVLGKLPLDPELARLCDRGEVEKYQSDAFTEFGEACVRVLSLLKDAR